VTANGNGEEKGCEVFFKESHRAGAGRPATQVVQNTNCVPTTRAPSGGDSLGQLPLLTALLAIALYQSSSKFSQIKGKKSISGHKIRALPTTKDFTLLDCVE